MYIDWLKISHIRNLEECRLEFPRGLILFYGHNAQGKTNILESLYLLSHARSFRGGRNEHIIRFEEEWGAVEGSILKGDQEDVVRIVLQRSKRYAFINGKRCTRLSELAGYVHFVTFTIDELAILRGVPGQRRQFIDKIVFNLFPSYMGQLREYNRVLKQRNVLLQSIRSGENTTEQLDTWTHYLIEYGAEILHRRLKAIDEINRMLSDQYSRFTGIEEIVKICYIPTSYDKHVLSSELSSRETIKELYEQKIMRLRRQEIERGYTLAGPHRDDFSVLIGGHDCYYYGSQGELRSVLIAIKMVEISLFEEKRRDSPIVLLDDILSELDSRRSQELLSGIDRNKQTFLSLTSLDMMKAFSPDVTLFQVSGGKVQRGKFP